MSFKAFIYFISEHYIVLTGTTLALFFTTSMVLLIRSLGKKGDGDSVTAAIDVTEIESAMKRVLSTQPVSVMASVSAGEGAAMPTVMTSATGGGADPAALKGLQDAVAERDAQIQSLLEQLGQAQSSDASGGSGDDEEKGLLKAKLEELQARLAEYEIIEDDIADLSVFKEENIRLKEEVASLKAQLANAPAAGASPAPVAAAAASASAASAEGAGAIKFEKSDKFELDLNDDVMKEFAAAMSSPPAPQPTAGQVAAEDPQAAIDAMFAGAVAAAPSPAVAEDPQAAIDAMLAGAAAPSPAAAEDPQAAIDAMLAGASTASPAASSDSEDVLAGSPNPDQLLSEVEAIQVTEGDDSHALEESTDTDKLVAEAGSLPDSNSTPAEDDIFAHFDKAQGN